MRFDKVIFSACLVSLLSVPLCLLARGGAAKETAGHLVVDMVVDHIEITAGFDGDWLKIYGVRPPRGDVVIALKGPKQTIKIRRKEHTAAGWRYMSNVTFKHVPSYYSVASTAPLTEILPKKIRTDTNMGIGMEALAFSTDAKPEQAAVFKKEFMRQQYAKNLYSEAKQGVTEISSNFFSTSFFLPDNVLIGDYEIEVLHVDKGAVTERIRLPFKVTHVGINSWALRVSNKHALLYGIMCVALAILSGWFSNRLKRIL